MTGRGPQRAEYEARMAAMDLRHVAFRYCRYRACCVASRVYVRVRGGAYACPAPVLRHCGAPCCVCSSTVCMTLLWADVQKCRNACRTPWLEPGGCTCTCWDYALSFAS